MIILVLISLILFAADVAIVCARYFGARHTVGRSIWVVALLLLFGSIWCLRLAADIYMADGLNMVEMVLNSAIHALQTFSLDDDYSIYLIATKKMTEQVFGSQVFGTVAGIYCSVENVLAPIMGGAAVLNLLSDVFPQFKLLLQFGRDKYVFSELNEQAVFLAESIIYDRDETGAYRRTQGSARKAIIFTNMNADSTGETHAKLVSRVRQLGGICIKDDPTCLRLRGKRRVFYLLLDQGGDANLNTAIALSENVGNLCPRAREINTLFISQDDNSADIISQMCARDECGRMITKVIRDDTGLAYDLLDSAPLYLPLLRDECADGLSIMTVGDSKFIKEFIKAAYWCGQMLRPGTDERLPMRLCALCDTGLRVELKAEMPGAKLDGTDPYCGFSFHDYDGSTDLVKLLGSEPSFADCNYIVVDTGDDRKSMDVSRCLRRWYDQARLTNGHAPLIYHLVVDPQLCDTVNVKTTESVRNDITAFGSMKRRYSEHNIFAPDLERKAYMADLQHDRAKYDEQKLRCFLRDEYRRRSSIANVLHAKYKLFSIGGELLDKTTGGISVNATVNDIHTAVDERADILAWLEHIRWNAYTISCGFCCPSDDELRAYFMQIPGLGGAKHEGMKLHPCIVDSDCTHLPIRYADWERGPSDDYDELDNFSLRFNLLRREKCADAWRQVEAVKECAMSIIARHIDTDGVLHDASDCKKALQMLGLDETACKLLLPDDFKRYDYYMLPEIPYFAMDYTDGQ